MAFDGTLMFGTGVDNGGFEQDVKQLSTAASVAVGNITSNIVSQMSAAMAQIPQQMVAVGSGFEASMSQVAATMGITSAAAEFETLSVAAKEMGESTKFSASQAGEALNYLALAGYDANKAVSALPTVLNVAAAGGMELASASDMITDAMSALGLETSQMSDFADKLAVTAQKSNTSVSQLGEAILTVGGTAKTLSGGVTEMNTALGILADNGIKGSEGGTMLRNVVLSLSAPTNKASEAIAGLGVSAFDAQGNLRPLQDVFYDLNTALSSLSQQEQNAVLTEIFNKEDLKGVNALLGTSAERFDELSGYIDNCAGAAEAMAETMDDNLQGDLTILGSALEGLGIAAYEKFQMPMRTAVQEVTTYISDLTNSVNDGELSSSMEKISSGFSELTQSALEFVGNNVIPVMISGLETVVDHAEELKVILTLAAAEFVALKAAAILTPVVTSIMAANTSLTLLAAETSAATFQQAALASGMSFTEIAVGLFTGKITAATAAEAAFNAVCSINPVVLLTTALAALGLAIGAIVSDMKEATEETNQYTVALENARTASQHITEDSDKEIAVIKRKAERYEELRQKYETLTDNEMAEFLDIVADLQEVLPENTKIIDEQSGAYLDLSESISKCTENMRLQAALSAKYEEYSVAASNYYDISKKIKTLEDDVANRDIHDPEGLFSEYDDKGLMNLLAKEWYGLSYDELMATKAENEKIMQGYEDLKEQAYSEMSSDDNSGTNPLADFVNDQMSFASELYTNGMQTIASAQEAATTALSDGWKKLEHEYATGTISSEAELWAQKSALLDKYGNADLEDHWKYYEELYGYQQDHADEAVRIAEKASEEQVAARQSEWENIERLNSLGLRTDEETAKARADFVKKYYGNADITTGEGVTDENYQYLKKVYDDNIDMTKQSLDEQEQIVDDGLSAIIKRYREAYNELEQNRKSYRDKLMSVGGDLFSVEEIENPDGSKSKQYTVNNIDEQLRKMREYNSAVKKLKAEGASEGLLSELTSLGSEDSTQFAKYLSGMSASEFAKINELYNEKQRLADELANDLYKDDAQRISNSMTDALGDLATSAYSYGAQAAEEFSKGFSEAANKLGINSLYSQLQAAESTKSYENYLTVNQSVPDVNVTVTPGTTSIYLDGKKIGEANTTYESQQSKMTGR